MDGSYEISVANLADAERINSLVNSAYRGEGSKKGWTTEADLLDGSRATTDLIREIVNKQDTQILKLEEGGRLLACVELRKEGYKLYLGMLTVDPELQGTGLGKILLREAENKAFELKCSTIYMSVISVRKELIDWYKRHGYQETGERKPFNMPDERWGIPRIALEFILLEKDLKQV